MPSLATMMNFHTRICIPTKEALGKYRMPRVAIIMVHLRRRHCQLWPLVPQPHLPQIRPLPFRNDRRLLALIHQPSIVQVVIIFKSLHLPYDRQAIVVPVEPT